MALQVWHKHFEAMSSGTKTAEGRINDGVFAEIKQGQVLFIINSEDGQSLTKMVTKRLEFNTFEDMIRIVGRKALLPDAKSDEEAVLAYLSFPGCSEREKKSGVVAFVFDND